ncbi:DNA binding protein [Aureococcus anophagefferens]|nr:DNA binding protein [Aureococcus anophagefferens]
MRLRPLLLCSSLAFAVACVVERAPTAAGIDRIGAVVDRIRTTQRFAAGVADRCAPLVDPFGELGADPAVDEEFRAPAALRLRRLPRQRRSRRSSIRGAVSSTALRLAWYDASDETPFDAHTDATFLTVAPFSPGLEFYDGAAWHAPRAAADDDLAVVWAGSLLEIVDATFAATVHRVVGTPEPRTSTPSSCGHPPRPLGVPMQDCWEALQKRDAGEAADYRPTDWAAMNGQLPPMFVPHHGGMAMRPQMVPQGGGQMLLPSEHMFVPPGVVLDASQFAAHAAARARHDYGADAPEPAPRLRRQRRRPARRATRPTPRTRARRTRRRPTPTRSTRRTPRAGARRGRGPRWRSGAPAPPFAGPPPVAPPPVAPPPAPKADGDGGPDGKAKDGEKKKPAKRARAKKEPKPKATGDGASKKEGEAKKKPELGSELITWDSGKIVIPGPSSRLAAVLPKYFRHGKFTSFQRQLNNFGFHKKISESSSKMRIYTRADMLGFPAEALLDLRRKPGASCASWEPTANVCSMLEKVGADDPSPGGVREHRRSRGFDRGVDRARGRVSESARRRAVPTAAPGGARARRSTKHIPRSLLDDGVIGGDAMLDDESTGGDDGVFAARVASLAPPAPAPAAATKRRKGEAREKPTALEAAPRPLDAFGDVDMEDLSDDGGGGGGDAGPAAAELVPLSANIPLSSDMDVSGLVDGGAEDEMEGFFAFLDNQVCGSVVSAERRPLQGRQPEPPRLRAARRRPGGALAMLQLDAFADHVPGDHEAPGDAMDDDDADAAAARRSSSRPTAGARAAASPGARVDDLRRRDAGWRFSARSRSRALGRARPEASGTSHCRLS